MQGLSHNKRPEQDEGDRFDNARGITNQKLGPLMHKLNVHNLLVSKWASSGGDDLSKYRKTSAEDTMAIAKKNNTRVFQSDWDAPLAAADSNCKGVIFYDPWNNGGHNLLKYPPFNDFELLAYAFIPTDYGVPEKDLKWHDIKRFNANFAKNIGTFNPKMTPSLGQQPPDVDPTKTAFQHDQLKIPQWGYNSAGIDTATGTYVGPSVRGQLSHNDTVKASK